MGISPKALFEAFCVDLREAGLSHVVEHAHQLDSPPPDYSYREFAAFSGLKSFLKKYEGVTSCHLNKRALEKFLHANSSCANWSLDYITYGDDELFGLIKDEAYFSTLSGSDAIYDSDDHLFYSGRCGPGASVGARGTDFYTKLFDSPLTSTSMYLYKLYKRETRNFPTWASAELIREAQHGSVRLVEGSRLSFVPKNDQISRIICVEPNLNMYFQLGLGRRLERLLTNRYGIDLALQPLKNRELARLGSENDSYVTIDLASASDSISLRMLNRILPPEFFAQLCRLRSPSTRLPDGTMLKLEMISSMGNGFTFPLQTLIFTWAVVAAFRLSGIQPEFPKGSSLGNFGVFGDDIIVPKAVAPKVFSALRLLGFTVNSDKTFIEGPFRESCGGDFFMGRNCRGFYLKRVKTIQDRYSAINGLNLWSARTGIHVSRTVKLLLASVPYVPVPMYETDDAGVKVPLCLAYGRIKFSKRTYSYMYSAYRADTAYIALGSKFLVTPRGLKRRSYNPDGLLLAILQGSASSRGIGTRHGDLRYKKKLAIAPFWDYSETAPVLQTGVVAGVLSDAIWFNLC